MLSHTFLHSMQSAASIVVKNYLYFVIENINKLQNIVCARARTYESIHSEERRP